MLAALLLAGLATAAFLPMMADAISDDDDLHDDPADDPVGAKVDVLSATASVGAVYDIPPTPSQTVLSSFDAEQDRCTLHIDDWDTEFVVEPMEDGGVSVSYGASEGVVNVCFPGQAELPTDAIQVVIQGPEDAAPVALGLEAVMEPDAGETPLAPTDADAPDDHVSGGGDAVALDPVDPDQPDIPGDTPVTEEVLSPVEDSDPTIPDDIPNIGWIYPDPAGGTSLPPVLDDFATDRDVLSVTLTPGAVDGSLDVAVAPSENGEDGVVTVDGQPVAILKGAPDAQPSQVFVEVRGKVTL